MAGAYYGVLKVAGSQLRGWLMDTAHPERRVRFNLVIDGQLRGTFAANKWRRFLLGRGEPGEDTHGFSIAIRKPWVSGELQSIRIEDPEKSALKFSLMARLGPSANTLFDDHVVSGQLSIGQTEPRARERKARIVDDEPDRDVRPAAANRALLRQIGMLSDTELANLLLAIDRDIVLERLGKHEKSGDWDSAFVYRRALTSAAAEQRLIAFGRGAMKAHNYGLAVRVTAAAAALHPQSFEANYLAGAARSLQGEFDEAMRYLRAADRLEEGGVRARREMVIVLARQMRGEMTPERRLELRNERLSLLRGLSASDDPQVRLRYRVPHAEALFGAGRYDEAVAAVDVVLSDAPNDTRALMIRARALVARNQIEDAVAVYANILDMDPAHRGARMNLRLLAALTEDESGPQAGAGSSVVQLHVFDASRGAGRGDDAQPDGLAARLAEISHSWICTTTGFSDENIAPEIQTLLDANAARRTGHAEIGLTDGRRLEFWRRDALLGLAESGLLNGLDDSVALARWRPFYGPRERIETSSRTTRPKRGVAALISRNGADLYGGGEHFLENAAEHHARQGFEPVIVGTRNDLCGEERIVAGRRCVFVGDKPADLRKFLLENEVSLVHAISGVGFSAADALNYTNIPFLYGVHFWSELLGDPDQTGYFDDVTGESRFRREFPLILSRATAIYANSHFTQRIIEDGFGVRCPVVFAVPRELA
jgi:tetratricopeptide (TPR) repeat protein